MDDARWARQNPRQKREQYLQRLALSVAMGDCDRTRALLDGSVRIAFEAAMGPDDWPDGAGANRATLEAFPAHHHDQGLSARRVQVEELLASTTYEMAKIQT